MYIKSGELEVLQEKVNSGRGGLFSTPMDITLTVHTPHPCYYEGGPLEVSAVSSADRAERNEG